MLVWNLDLTFYKWFSAFCICFAVIFREPCGKATPLLESSWFSEKFSGIANALPRKREHEIELGKIFVVETS